MRCGAAGEPPRSPASSLSRSNTPRGLLTLQGIREAQGAPPRAAGGEPAPAAGILAPGALTPGPNPAGALPVPRRAGARGWRGGGEGLEPGSAGQSGGFGGLLSAAGSPTPSSLDRCVSYAAEMGSLKANMVSRVCLSLCMRA